MKRSYVIKIAVNGEITAEPVDDQKLLDALQRLVGGYIQICPSAPQTPHSMLKVRQALVVNEEGKINDLHYNPTATAIYGNPLDHIFGNAVIVKTKYDDIVPFGSLEYVNRNIIAPLKYRLAKSLEAADDE